MAKRTWKKWSELIAMFPPERLARIKRRAQIELQEMDRQNRHVERIIQTFKELDDHPGPTEWDILIHEIAVLIVRVENLEKKCAKSQKSS